MMTSNDGIEFDIVNTLFCSALNFDKNLSFKVRDIVNLMVKLKFLKFPSN